MKIELVGLDKNDAGDQKLFGKFQEFVKREGLRGLAEKLRLDVKPGASFKITRPMLKAMFGERDFMTLMEFLTKYASPEDLVAYDRVAALHELHDKLYMSKD